MPPSCRLRFLTAQHARRNIVLPREIAEFIELVLDFLHLSLKNREAPSGVTPMDGLVHRHARLSDAIGRQAPAPPAPAGGRLGACRARLEDRRPFGIPFGIVEPGCIDRKRSFGRRGGRLRRRCCRFLADNGNQAARAQLVQILVGPDFLGLILIALRGAGFLCGLRRTRKEQ